MTELELSAETIDAIARRVVELLDSPPPSRQLIDAAELARRLGVTRSWVYEHASQLDVIRLGSGRAPRLRFDPVKVEAALTPRPRSQPPTPPARRPGRPRRRPSNRVPLLPIYDGS